MININYLVFLDLGNFVIKLSFTFGFLGSPILTKLLPH